MADYRNAVDLQNAKDYGMGAIVEQANKLREFLNPIKNKQDAAHTQQSHIVDPKTGKSMAGVFDPNEGKYTLSGFESGYAPKTDPVTGYIIPSSTAQTQGLAATGNNPTPAPTLNNMITPSQPQAQPNQQATGPTTPPSQAPQTPPTINPKQREGAEHSLARLNADPVYKENTADVIKMNSLIEKSKLAQQNPVASAQLGAEVAKLYEGGRLTDDDVVRYTRDPSAAGRIRDGITKLAQGVHSPETMDALRIALEAKRAQSQQVVKDLSSAESERMGSMYGTSKSAGDSIITPPSRQKALAPSKSKEAKAVKPAVHAAETQPREGIVGALKSFFTPKSPPQETEEQELNRLKAKHRK